MNRHLQNLICAGDETKYGGVGLNHIMSSGRSDLINSGFKGHLLPLGKYLTCLGLVLLIFIEPRSLSHCRQRSNERLQLKMCQ